MKNTKNEKTNQYAKTNPYGKTNPYKSVQKCQIKSVEENANQIRRGKNEK